MNVIKAESLGLCFGVRDALEFAFAREDATSITVYGELVHNETVLRRLRDRGFQMAPEAGREARVDTDKVLITAHGISNRERFRLESEGLQLLDTTCPLVQKVHNAALRLQEGGYFPVVIGKHGHVEVLGVVGDLDEHAVVATVAEARSLRTGRPRIGVVCQTTFPEATARKIVAALRQANPEAELRFQNTTCDPTRQRMAAVQQLLPRVDAMVVVGGRNSNNTRQLVRVCEDAGVLTFHIQGPTELEAHRFVGCQVVGLTAGTSTLDEVVEAVHAALEALETVGSSA